MTPEVKRYLDARIELDMVTHPRRCYLDSTKVAARSEVASARQGIIDAKHRPEWPVLHHRHMRTETALITEQWEHAHA